MPRIMLSLILMLWIVGVANAQEPIRVVFGNPDCSEFHVAARGDVVFPVWVDFENSVGAGSMRLFLIDPAATEWVGVNFHFPWEFNYSIDGNTLQMSFLVQGVYPNTLFHLADIIFELDADSSYFGGNVQAIAVGAMIFSDTAGYVLHEYTSCVSPLCIECQTAIDNEPPLPGQISHVAFPNPFNSSVTISVDVPYEADLKLAIFDVSGRAIKNISGRPRSGSWQVVWDGRDDRGIEVSSGVYFYRIEFDKLVSASKITLLR